MPEHFAHSEGPRAERQGRGRQGIRKAQGWVGQEGNWTGGSESQLLGGRVAGELLGWEGRQSPPAGPI